MTKNKISWFYYISHHGPGHQSTTGGYAHFRSDQLGKVKRGEIPAEVIEHVSQLLSDVGSYGHDWIEIWPIPGPPSAYLDKKVEGLQNRIKYAQEELALLAKSKKLSDTLSEKGADPEIPDLMKEREENKVLQALHKAGLMVSHDDLRSWRQRPLPSGAELFCRRPQPKDRKKIIQIIKKVPKRENC